MTNDSKKFHIISAIVVMILGTLLHFTYNLSNQNPFIALFSAVNESTWEHLKLTFFPMLLTSIIGGLFIFKSNNNYWCSRAVGIVAAILFTVIFFYTYIGVIGKNNSFINISSFFVSIIIGEFTSYKVMKKGTLCDKHCAIAGLALLTLSFILFTFYPPHIGLFKDPLTGTFGVQ